MESRKVQRVGHSTLTVSVPSKWAKQQKIRAGDLVFLIAEDDGTLKVVPSHLAQREETEEHIINSDACDEQGMLGRLIVGSYILGHDTIRITSSCRITKKRVDAVRRVADKLIGLSILEETPKNILLQCSIDPSKFQLDLLIRRSAIISATILSEAIQAFTENTKSLAEEAIKREDEVDKIFYLAVRLLLSAQRTPRIADQIGLTDHLFIPAARLILQYIELAGDYSEQLAKRIIALDNYRYTLNKEVVARIHNISEVTQTIFQKSIDCIFSHDLKIANGLLEMRKVHDIEVERFMDDGPKIPYLRAIVLSLKIIADIGATITNISINRALKLESKHIAGVVRSVKYTRKIFLPKNVR